MDKLWLLSQINIFEALPTPDLVDVERMTSMSTVPKSTMIIRPGDASRALFLLKKGRVRLFKVSPEGREFTLAILGDGNIFGETEGFSLGMRDVCAQAMEDSCLCVLQREDMEKLVQSKPALALNMMRVLSQRLNDAVEMLEALALRDARTRLVYLLLKLAEHFGQESGEYTRIDVSLSHQDLASMIGVTRESVTQALSALAKKGIVKTRRREIRINRDRARQEIELL